MNQTSNNPKVAIITGTTSGIGLALMKQLLAENWLVYAINRRVSPELAEKYPLAQWLVADITDENQISALLNEIQSKGPWPSLFLLNAGINLADNTDAGFSGHKFRENITINLFGVLSFVSAATRFSEAGSTFVCLSSVSNLVPNPGHIGYFISKWALLHSFRMISRRDKKNRYHCVVLGPVRTEIFRNYVKPSGLAGWALSSISVDTSKIAPQILKLPKHRNVVVYLPKRAKLFYLFLRVVIFFLPCIYKGTRIENNATSR